MKTTRMDRWFEGVVLGLALFWAIPVSAQTTFSSGSTGALGAFAPASNTSVTLPPDGVLNYTTVNIPSGVTVTFVKNAANTPVTMLATGDVTITGTISVNGSNGIIGTSGVVVNNGGAGGPGGFTGGRSGSLGQTNNAGAAGLGPGGGTPVSSPDGTYGAPSSFVSLLPLFGGSGGAGGSGNSSTSGSSGGGGGGALVIASTTKITVNGSVTANGGTNAGCGVGIGSGGAIRLVAPTISIGGILQAFGGTNVCTGTQGQFSPANFGRIRLEAVAFGPVTSTTPTASISNTLGPITTASTPALINLPTLTISSVGGVNAPATPSGSYGTADVSLPSGTTNPVTVSLTANNIPVGTVYTVKLIPQFANPTSVSSTAATGTFAVSTATASVTFPSGFVSILNAFASFTLTASLFPLIDGEEVDRVMVAANYGAPSTATVITKSGKEARVDQLSIQDQLAFAKGLEAMQRSQ